MTAEGGYSKPGEIIMIPRGAKLTACFQNAYSNLPPDTWAFIHHGIVEGRFRLPAYIRSNQNDLSISYKELVNQLTILVVTKNLTKVDEGGISNEVAEVLKEGIPTLIRELAGEDTQFVTNALEFMYKERPRHDDEE